MGATLFGTALVAMAQVTVDADVLNKVVATGASGTVVGVVVLFLRYLSQRDADMRQKDEALLTYLRASEERASTDRRSHDDGLKSLGDTCHAFQREMMGRFEAVVTRNGEALSRNTEAMGRIAEALADAEPARRPPARRPAG